MTIFQSPYELNAEETRLNRLDTSIDELFCHLSQHEIDTPAGEFERIQTRMLEIVAIRKKSCIVMDLCEDIEFGPVLLPEKLMACLRRHDTFLMTIGFVQDSWKILYMSRPYRTETFNLKGNVLDIPNTKDTKEVTDFLPKPKPLV